MQAHVALLFAAGSDRAAERSVGDVVQKLARFKHTSHAASDNDGQFQAFSGDRMIRISRSGPSRVSDTAPNASNKSPSSLG
jgi:hypothetical protein